VTISRRTSLDRRRVLARLGLATGSALALPWVWRSARSRGDDAPRIALGDLEVLAADLPRAEGIVADCGGRVYASNSRSACAVVDADGTRHDVGPPLSGNGIAMDAQRRIVIACFGLLDKRPGPLLRLDLASGTLETLAATLDGRTLVASNFPVVARDGAIYCSHSTWGPEPAAGMDPARADGFIYRVDTHDRVAVVADGLAGANGCCFDKAETHLYVALTAAGRIVRLRRRADGSLGEPEPYGPVLGPIPRGLSVPDLLRLDAAERSRLGYVDGIGFDAAGRLWATMPIGNRIVVITADGGMTVAVDDPAGSLLDSPTNLAWGGPDLHDLYIASRQKGAIIRTRSPAPGLPLVHQLDAGCNPG
jgi:gluconolactonase